MKHANFNINLTVNGLAQAELTCTGYYRPDQRHFYNFKDASFEVLVASNEQDSLARHILTKIWYYLHTKEGVRISVQTGSQMPECLQQAFLNYISEYGIEGESYSVVVKKTSEVDDDEEFPSKMPIVANFLVKAPRRPEPEIVERM